MIKIQDTQYDTASVLNNHLMWCCNHTEPKPKFPHSNLEYLNSIEGDDALTTELKDEHEDEDDEEWMENSDLEDVAEAKVLRRLRWSRIHGR